MCDDIHFNFVDNFNDGFIDDNDDFLYDDLTKISILKREALLPSSMCDDNHYQSINHFNDNDYNYLT